MNRTKILTIVKDIHNGRTFMRSQLPQTVKNKKLWDELRSEIKTDTQSTYQFKKCQSRIIELRSRLVDPVFYRRLVTQRDAI